MCGFTGLFQPADGPCDRAVVARMTQALAHRGPDADGIWTRDGVALGHRRLSILDLSEAGAQPMQDASGRFVLAYNGEIYNHLALRADLHSAGAAPDWRSHSDTETLLAGIAHWGLDETLTRAAGMFALALWDQEQGRLSLARDRMGEKPLYWGWAGTALVFGSELKALRQHPDCPTHVCKDAFAQYLTHAYVPAPRSIHPGIYKLEPGCILDIAGPVPPGPPQMPLRPGQHHGAVSIRRYWSLTDTLQTGHDTQITAEDDAVTAVETALSRAVNRQVIADVPLGAFLSGGIDSSLIVALMQAQTQQPVKTFTVGFENAAFNEAPHAAAVAAHLGTDHTEITVTEREALDVIPMLPDLYDEPFADSSQIPTHLVCRAARAHVTVALSGDAGDELFGGYNRHVLGPRIWRRFERIPKPLRQGMGHLISAAPAPVWDWLGRRMAVSQTGDKARKLARALRDVDHVDDLYRSLISTWPDDSPAVTGSAPAPSVLDDPLPDFLQGDPAARMMAQDMRSYLPDDILCKVDRAAMGISLETRVPFLDPDVIALSARVPTTMKVRDGQGKWVLRQVLYKHVPRHLIERPKTGFSIPLGDWLRGPLRPWAETLLSADALGADGLIDPAPVMDVWRDHLSGRKDGTQKLWVILMFQAWRAQWS